MWKNIKLFTGVFFGMIFLCTVISILLFGAGLLGLSIKHERTKMERFERMQLLKDSLVIESLKRNLIQYENLKQYENTKK